MAMPSEKIQARAWKIAEDFRPDWHNSDQQLYDAIMQLLDEVVREAILITAKVSK